MTSLTEKLDRVLGKVVADTLAEDLNLHTVGDLLRYYPDRYVQSGKLFSQGKPEAGEHVTVIAQIVKEEMRQMRNRRGQFLKVTLSDGKTEISATFFNPHKVKRDIKVGARGMFSGVVGYFRDEMQFTHPAYLIIPESSEAIDDSVIHDGSTKLRASGKLRGIAEAALGGGGSVTMSEFTRPFLPLYSATKNVQSWMVWTCVRQVLDQLDPVDDPLPEYIRKQRNMIDVDTALHWVHLPEEKSQYVRARERLRFDEAASLQLVLAQRRYLETAKSAPACPKKTQGLCADFDRQLPFTLTAGQLEVGQQISADLAQPHPMNRLLQGEVGSGKTVVALQAMLQVIDSGRQCALLAPTEVLAAQHARSLRLMLGDLATAGELGAPERATRICLLTGSLSTARKRQALLETVTGDAGIVIGTHALIQDNVEFFDLGLVIVDEQHRFGVEQRDALRAKTREGVTAHLLVMTATPIPRTVAMTVFGDLATSTLKELPKGRSPIVSNVIAVKEKPHWMQRAWERIVEEVVQGRQAYVVCSRIGEAENVETDDAQLQTHAVLDVYGRLSSQELSAVRVGVLHGRLSPEEKDDTMTAFARREIDVLVCTTVVEVGVDVPNATVMMILDADRFGVSQLHQLRGRVGRGKHAGLCFLATEIHPGSPAFERLTQVAATNDGFALAQLDLVQRKEGNVLGKAQSGTVSNLRLLSLLDDAEVIADAREFTSAIIKQDPTLQKYPGLATMVKNVLDSQHIDYLDKS
ncbi:MAG: ATP-dependent DNA helicase RecG [Mycobacteriaceae bacterium]